MTQDHTNKIEETLAHQEQQITDLSDMIIAQARDITALKKQVEKLQNKITIMQSDGDEEGKQLSSIEEAAQNIPPHY